METILASKWIRAAVAIGAVVGLIVAWYLISPIWRTSMVNEVSPLATREQMDEEERERFEAELEDMADETKEMDEASPASSRLVVQAPFIPADHDVAGQALLIEEDGSYTVRFEDFASINGPNLRIWLATDTSGEDYVDLGALKATHGNVNYAVPPGTDVSVYDTVLVWCVPFAVLFSYASLAQ